VFVFANQDRLFDLPGFYETFRKSEPIDRAYLPNCLIILRCLHETIIKSKVIIRVRILSLSSQHALLARDTS
jgi:hypothetical protein